MAIHFTTGAQPETRVSTGGEAQTTPENLRLGLRLSCVRSGLIWLAVGTTVTTCSVIATVGLIAASFMNGQAETVLFTAVTVTTAWLMAAFSLATGSTLMDLYRENYSRADEANRQNVILRSQNLRLMAERARRLEGGEAGDGAGHALTSPASLRFIPHKGRVQ